MSNLICPHCNNTLILQPNNAFINTEIYGNYNKVVTSCCNKMISIGRKISFNIIRICDPNIIEDDWGNKIKK